jgi:iron complex transport system substrate-binding protein
MKIVSLIPSATEIVCGLGFQEFLVGRSHECDEPREIATLPALTAPRFDPEGTSRQIDERVKSLAVRSPAEDALGVYAINREILAELAPTHVVTQTQCEVCAVSLRDVEDAVAALTGVQANIVSLQPNALDDVWDDFRRVGAALGNPSAAERLVAGCQERIAAVAAKVRGAPRPRVAGIEWVDPLMAFGNWTPTLIELAGGKNLFGKAGEHSPWIQFDELVTADPDVIVIAPCGFSLERGRLDLPLLRQKPGWDKLRAVESGQVYLADGNQFFNRPGPRLAETVETLGQILHPELCGASWQGVGWERVER